MLSLIGCKVKNGQKEIVNEAITKIPNPPKNIILMIGDGMGLSQITAGMYRNGNKLNLERCKVIGLIKTNSKKQLITRFSCWSNCFCNWKKNKKRNDFSSYGGFF